MDRFFSDNWVVSFYMGSLANLIEWWEPYKARMKKKPSKMLHFRERNQ